MIRTTVTALENQSTTSHETLRGLARDMAAALAIIAEGGCIDASTPLALLDRWAITEHLVATDAALNNVRVHRLLGALETDYIAAKISTHAADARCVITVGLARDWMAGAFREAIGNVRATFPELFAGNKSSAHLL